MMQCPVGGTPSRSREGVSDADRSAEMKPAEAPVQINTLSQLCDNRAQKVLKEIQI